MTDITTFNDKIITEAVQNLTSLFSQIRATYDDSIMIQNQRLGARFGLDDLEHYMEQCVLSEFKGEDRIGELHQAILQEIEADIVCGKLLPHVRGSNVVEKVVVEHEDLQSIGTHIATKVRELHDPVVILSPTVLSVLQSGTSIARSANSYLPDTQVLKRVGTFYAQPVLCDQYAMDRSPVIIASEGWLKYRFDKGVFAGPMVTDPATFQTVQSYTHDFTFRIDPTKMRFVEPNVFWMGFI